jgi:hypothetical protein
MGDASTLPESYLATVTGWQMKSGLALMDQPEPSLRMGNYSTPHTYLKGGMLSPSGKLQTRWAWRSPSQNDALY